MKQNNAEFKSASQVAKPVHAYAHNRLVILDKRLGVGVGAKRERERLAKILAS